MVSSRWRSTTTDGWSLTGNPPSEPRVPPLPDDDEAFIARPILVPNTTDYEGHYEFTLVIEDYNPEWISIDVMGCNIDITNGVIVHECAMGTADTSWGAIKSLVE